MNELIEKHLNRVEGLKSEGTFKKRRSDLRRFDEWLESTDREPEELGSLELEEYFIDQSSEGYAPETLSVRFQSVRGFYGFLSDKLGKYDDNPFEGLNRSDYVDQNGSKKFDQGEICYITAEEKELMCENVPDPKLRNELLIRLMFQTGLRRSEVANLEVEDIDRDEREIYVWSPKTGESRTVWYQPSLDILLDQYLDRGYRSQHPDAAEESTLFLTRKGPIRKNRINRIVRKAAENAAIQEILYHDHQGVPRYRISSHTLRHSFAVNALKSGIDIRNLQKALGHADIERTMQYLQVVDSDVKDAFRAFDPQPED